jgi:membrane-bound lytic murein transglycosylase D
VIRRWLLVLLVPASLAAQVQNAPAASDAPLPPDVAYQPSALEPEDGVLPPDVMTFPEATHRYIDRQISYFQADEGHAWLLKTIARARPYRDWIRRKIDERHMPPELFWLVAIESGFDPGDTSRVGATGLWQFMKNSIDGYGMRITPYVDERRDFWKSTEGALSKLADNYAVLGDWYLALAAYNAGLGRIQGAIKRAHGERDYWKLLDQGRLPRETAMYVPELLALVKLTAHWDENGLPADWDPSPEWDRVHVDRMVDVRLLAEAAGVPVNELRDVNRELVYHLTPVLPQGYDLKVRTEWAEPLRTALADPSLKLVKYYLYTVQKGDTLSEIALWYGVSQAMIERDNPRLNPSLLRIGQNLVIAAVKDIGPYRKGAAP